MRISIFRQDRHGCMARSDGAVLIVKKRSLIAALFAISASASGAELDVLSQPVIQRSDGRATIEAPLVTEDIRGAYVLYQKVPVDGAFPIPDIVWHGMMPTPVLVSDVALRLVRSSPLAIEKVEFEIDPDTSEPLQDGYYGVVAVVRLHSGVERKFWVLVEQEGRYVNSHTWSAEFDAEFIADESTEHEIRLVRGVHQYAYEHEVFEICETNQLAAFDADSAEVDAVFSRLRQQAPMPDGASTYMEVEARRLGRFDGFRMGPQHGAPMLLVSRVLRVDPGRKCE